MVSDNTRNRGFRRRTATGGRTLAQQQRGWQDDGCIMERVFRISGVSPLNLYYGLIGFMATSHDVIHRARILRSHVPHHAQPSRPQLAIQ